MSKQIDFSKPLTDDDRQYLTDRAQEHVIARVEAKHAEKGSQEQAKTAEAEQDEDWLAGPGPESTSDSDWLEHWTVPQLKSQLEYEGVVFPKDSKKTELKTLVYECFDAREDDPAE